MTKLQVIFLLVTMIYLVAKVFLGYIIYLVTLQIEAAALERQRKRQAYLAKTRARDRERYKEAYQWYEKRMSEQAPQLPAPEPEAKPDVFTETTAREGSSSRVDKEILREAYQY